MLFFVLALPFATADTGEIRGPARCEAVFQGPIDGCELAGSWGATGTGPNQRRARRHAVARLQELMTAVIDSREAQRSDGNGALTAAKARLTCPDVVAEKAQVYCYAEEDLDEWGLCFAHLNKRDCWRGMPIQLEGPGWRVMEQGRERLCEAIDESLAERGEDDAQRKACQVRCLEDSEVSCPR